MRLVCPNCGAQYEVDDSVIPEGGRDVQCSRCAHGWFQAPDRDGAPRPSAAPIPQDTAPSMPAPDTVPSPEPAPEPEPEPEATPAPSPETASEPPPVPEQEAEPEVDETTPAPEDLERPSRREIDADVRAILQEEMNREMAARAGDGVSTAEPAPDTAEQSNAQTDADALARDVRPAPGRDRVATATAATATVAVAAAAAGATASKDADKSGDKISGRDLFPDIDEINSTLDGVGIDSRIEEMDLPRERSGFGRAFMTVVILAALLLALYLAAPKIADVVPALKPALSAYVDMVNAARGWLDGVVQGLTDRMTPAE